MTLEPVLTPHGVLTLRQTGKALASESEEDLRLEKAFIRGSATQPDSLQFNSLFLKSGPTLSANGRV